MMLIMWTVKLFVYTLVLKISSGDESIVLNIPQGLLKGQKKITAYHSLPFYSFKGIPYAKPNVGRDKFNIAVPLKKWSGTLDATKHRDVCPQINQKKFIGAEDCLFLNVYTPDLNENAKRAVMVYIHGGGFHIGDGNDESLGADFLIEKDVILVTMNYRLGVIGFLNAGDGSVPDNIGLKDQNLALKWVQENIIKFGGCPKRVTIFGQSAGGASVHFHVLSPMSQGLFKGAIIQSGSAVCPWAFTYNSKENAMRLANIMNLMVTNTENLVDQLKNKTAQELIKAAEKMGDILEMHEVFVPSVEANVGQNVFLPDDPWKIITSGKIADVPMIIGITEKEIGFASSIFLPILTVMKDPLVKFIPAALNATDEAQIKPITTVFNKYYFNNMPMFMNPTGVSNILDDAAFNHAVLISAAIMNERISSPVYKYILSYYTPNGPAKQKYPLLTYKSAVHCDDLVFIFYAPKSNNLPQPGSQEEQKLNEFIEMWTNFAKEGNPSATNESAKVVWEPMVGPMGKNYLDIGLHLTLKNFLWRDRVGLWAKLYKNIIGGFIELFD
ncbi:hypothetical protein PV326_009584 [Microctonus aethiopoides]|nr:hypothetical protein PV326_009584 [Microctonus aethiopoides]